MEISNHETPVETLNQTDTNATLLNNNATLLKEESTLNISHPILNVSHATVFASDATSWWWSSWLWFVWHNIYCLGGLLVGSTLIGCFINHHINQRQTRMGVKMRIACCSLIFRKVSKKIKIFHRVISYTNISYNLKRFYQSH